MTTDKHNKRAAREGISYTAARRRLLQDQTPTTEDGLVAPRWSVVHPMTARRDGELVPCGGQRTADRSGRRTHRAARRDSNSSDATWFRWWISVVTR